MKKYRKVAIAVTGLFLFVLVLNFTLSLWISSKLESILNKSDSSFTVQYNTPKISLFSGSIALENISLIPKKENSSTEKKIKIAAEIKAITVSNIGVLGILFNDKIKANNLIVTHPKITILTQHQPDKKEREEAFQSINKTFQLSSIYLKNADITIKNEPTKNILFAVTNLSINLNGIKFSDRTINEKIPFSFSSYSLKCDSIYYHESEFYDIKVAKITALNSKIKVRNFTLTPLFNRKQFVQKLSTEKDLYTISTKEILISGMDWGFRNSNFFFRSESILVDNMSASIFRNKQPKDDLTKKKLYNKLLRDLKFELKVDSLKIRNSHLLYEEEVTFEKGPGKLFFDQFNLTASNIQSGFKKTKMADLNIKVNCTFMKTSALHIDWKLNVLDKNDSFSIHGTIADFDMEKLNPFTKPYINVKTEGIFNKVVFDFTGNDVSSTGKFALEYDDLKVTIFKKNDRKKKSKLLSAIGNLFVKNDTKDKLKSVDVSVTRVQENSFYNFLWLTIAEGLKKVLI